MAGYYMNIYAQEDCNDYKSTQDLNPNGIPACLNIDWAESFAVDVSSAGDEYSLGCSTTYFGNENCETPLGQIESVGNSGCKDPPVSRNVEFIRSNRKLLMKLGALGSCEEY